MLRERIEECIARAGLLYPWWVPLTSVVGQLVCVGIALGPAMRDRSSGRVPGNAP